MRRLLIALMLAAGCASPTDPLTVSGLPRSTAEAIVGTWALQSWNTKPVPALYDTHLHFDPEKQVPCTVPPYSSCPPSGVITGGFVEDSVTRIASGSITLNDDATYARTTNWRIDRMDGTTQRAYTTTEQGSYTGSVAGGFVTLNLFGAVRMQIAVSGNAMSAKYAVEQQPPQPPIVLGDVWAYVK